MIVKEIIDYLDEIAPFEFGEDFDNNGLIIGRVNSSFKKILITIDVTNDVVHKAIKDNVDIIISHHPYIFEPIKKITDNIILQLIENNIAYISAHTNYDNGRLRDLFANKLLVNESKKIHKGDNGGFFGGIGQLNYEISTSDYIKLIKTNFDIPYVKLIGKKKETIKTVAFGNGSTSYYIDEILSLNCDVYVTGEVKYHDELIYSNNNCFIISLGHYESEKIFSLDLKKLLQEKFTKSDVLIYNDQTSKII